MCSHRRPCLLGIATLLPMASASLASPLCLASAYTAPVAAATITFPSPIITATSHRAVSRLRLLHHGPVGVRFGRLICGSNGRNRKTLAPIDESESQRRIVQATLWFAEAVYILWLFLLPYAPGDPVWAISSATINDLLGLSLNFFFILPFLNAVGFHLIEAPTLHPMAEGLFNFVIGWTFLFAPLLYTDVRRDRYKGSLDVLWGFQMFLTNTFLIPYMAIRLNDAEVDGYYKERSQLGTVLTNGAPVVGLVGGAICLISAVWAFYGRMDGNFGGVPERWEFLLNYLGSERLAYAFIWDICLYSIFQPWLIGDNLRNVKEDNVNLVRYLRYVPVVGLAAYLLSLKPEEK